MNESALSLACFCECKLKHNEEITKLVTIINVYGPTSQRAERDPDKLDSFYTKLDETINSVGRSSILILAGDFNAKVGHKQQIDYTCIGNYSKGKRNHNGKKIARILRGERTFHFKQCI